MSTNGYKAVRYRPGRYNYRGICFERDERLWVIRNEDGGAYHSAKTIKAMRRYIDRNYRTFL